MHAPGNLEAAPERAPRPTGGGPGSRRSDICPGWSAELQARLRTRLEELWTGVSPSLDRTALRTALVDAVDGGKRARPRLVAAVHDALGGQRPDAVLDAAAAVELLHTAFVVHDDLIDGDDLRRGRPSVLGRFRASGGDQGAARGADAYAVAGAVLAGDLALTVALRTVAQLSVPDPVRARVLSLVGEAITTSATGELADVRLALGATLAPEQDEVLDLAARKTAAYSFALPMQLGALLADADTATVEAVGRAGRSAGIAFQLHDDLAGMFDDALVTGKDPVSDLREGKLTLLISHARATPAWPLVAPHWGDPGVTIDDLRVVRRVLEESGSRTHVEAVAAVHLQAGLRTAERAGVDRRTTTWLASLLARPAEAAA